MPSKTAITEYKRSRKESRSGLRRKRLNLKLGTINYHSFFETPAKDDATARPKPSSKKTASK